MFNIFCMTKKEEFCCSPIMKNIGLLVLRMCVGSIFIYAGWNKFADIETTTAMFDSFGFAAPWFFAYLVSLTELISGTAVLLGILTRDFALVLAFIMLVALLVVHLGQDFARAQLPLALFGATLGLWGAGGGDWQIMKKDCLCMWIKG